MRHEEDYILRLFQQFGRLWARVVFLANGSEYAQAQTEIEQATGDLFGLSPDSLLQIADADIVTKLQFDDRVNWAPKCALLAALFNESAALYEAEGRLKDSYSRYLKALGLLLHVLTSGVEVDVPDNTPTVSELSIILKDVILPDETRTLLMGYYEQIGQFAKAEDVLFAWLDDDPSNLTVLELGMVFYERLGIMDDADLSMGNLPRAEVEAGLNELMSRM